VLILAFDTATRWGRYAVVEDGRLLAYVPHNVMGNHADAVLPVVDAVLAAAGRSLDEVGLIGVTDGPGSFTGVRIGVATAKGLAYALEADLAAVPTLAAMAADLLSAHADRVYAVPVLDARRGEVYAAVYRREGDWVAPVRAPFCLAPDAAWLEVLAVVTSPEDPVYGGDGTALLVGEGDGLRQELRGCGDPVTRPWSSAHPATARALALALSDPALRAAARVHPFALTPRYLRVSDAETARDLDLTPSRPNDDIGIHAAGGDGGRP
jgi:tRNA threonylcarbamoyladenosine biosynthesis protein TsaB